MEVLHPSSSEPPGIDSLLEYEPFVRAVARGLLSDEAQVDDIVQETWTRALKKPPGHGRAIKAWLAKVVRNLAMDLRRGEGRRRAREGAARDAPAAVEPVDELQSRLEAHQAVIASVLALGEPYQSVVMLVYYQGMSPGDAAEKLGRKPATVRTQLCRAHEILRERLDDKFDGDRAAWAILAVPFSWPTAPLPITDGGAASAGVGLGVKLMLGVILTTALAVVPDWGGEPDRDLSGIETSFVPLDMQEPSADAQTQKGAVLALDDSGMGRTPLAPSIVPSAKAPALFVQVVDADGLPVLGVPVVLGAGVEREVLDDVVVRKTVAGGADFRGFEELISVAGEATSFYRVRASIPGLDRDEVLVGLAKGALRASRHIELELGPSGAVTLELRRGDGQLYDFDGDVQLTLRGQVETLMPTVPLVGGRARFPWVGLGGQLIVRARVPSLGLRWDFTADGPQRPGEDKLVVFEPQIDTKLPWLAGRALGANGQPLANAQLHLSVLDAKRLELARLAVRTDSQGNFTAQITGNVAPGDELQVRVLLRGEESWAAMARTNLTLAPHANLLGDLNILETCGAITGRCVDTSGRPLAGVPIVAAQDYFERVSSAITDDNGSFEMHGLFTPRVTMRTLSPTWMAQEDLEVTPADGPVEIVLARGGKIKGTLRLAPGIDPLSFRVTAVREEDTPLAFVGPEAHAAVHPTLSAFVLKGLRSDTYTCRVFRRGELVHEVRGIEVSAPGETRVPTIDLRSDFAPIQLTILDAEGAPARGVIAKLFDGDQMVDRATGDGTVTLVATRDIVDPVMTIEAKGCSPLVVRPGEDRDLRAPLQLEAGVDLKLVFSQVPELEAGEVRADVYLEWLDAPAPLEIAVRLPCEILESGGGAVRLPGPGTYRLAFVLHRPAGDSPRVPYGAGDFLINVEAKDSGGSLDLPLPASMVR